MLKQLIQNWKTTSLGLTAICGATVHIVFACLHHTADENSWVIFFGAIIGGLAAIFAGDSNVSAKATDTNAKEIDRINQFGSSPAAPSVSHLAPNPPLTNKP
jgi:hypothetical protein